MAERSSAGRLAARLGYQAKRGLTYVAARETVFSLTTENLMHGMMGASAAFGGAGLLLVGGIGGVSAALTLMDYRKSLDELVQIYDEELATKLGKAKKDLTRDDLFTLAKGDPERGIEPNYVLQDQLNKERKKRNFDIVFSVAASLGALTAVLAATSFFPALAAGGALATVGKMAVGFLAFNAVKRPLHHVADKLFDVERETTHDHIVALSHCLQKGVSISKENVLSVFTSANPELDLWIKNRNNGVAFEDMNASQQAHMVQQLEPYLKLEKLTEDLNRHRISATELAFRVQGDASGVMHADLRPLPEKGFFEKAWDKVSSLVTGDSKDVEAEIRAAQHESMAKAAAHASNVSRTAPANGPANGRSADHWRTQVAGRSSEPSLTGGTPARY